MIDPSKEPVNRATTVGKYQDDKPQSIKIKYEESSHEYELWDAVPSCTHEIRSACGGGIRCTKCGGWCCF